MISVLMGVLEFVVITFFMGAVFFIIMQCFREEEL